jgi:hypothetical protein
VGPARPDTSAARQHDLALLEPLPEQAPEDRRVEDVVRNEQHEVPLYDAARGEERAGVSRLPGLVADRADREVPSQRELPQERLDARGVATRHGEEPAQPGLEGGDDCPLQERQAKNRDERLGTACKSQAATAARGEDHAASRRAHDLNGRVCVAGVRHGRLRPSGCCSLIPLDPRASHVDRGGSLATNSSTGAIDGLVHESQLVSRGMRASVYVHGRVTSRSPSADISPRVRCCSWWPWRRR